MELMRKLSIFILSNLLKIGVNDTYGESGPAVELIKKYGLDSEGIYAKVKEFMA